MDDLNRRVVVTGLGTVNPLGCSVEEFWEGLLSARSGVAEIQGFDASDFEVRIAGEVRDFDPGKYMDRRLERRLDRFVQFALAAAAQAVEDCGFDADKTDPMRVGVIVGSGIGGLSEIETQHERLLKRGPGKISPLMIPKLMVNAAAGQVSIRYGLKGPNMAVATACASGNHAIGDAFKIVKRGEADIMFAGGAEAAVTPLGVGGFASMRALSCRNDDPERASRPFDRDRDGFVVGEGAGMVILEERQHALKRGATIYAEMLGYGMSGDGSHITAPDAEGVGAAKAMQKAIEDAGISTGDIDYINAHGTSTVLGDVAETVAIKRLFGEDAKRLMVSSTKSMIGHLLGASGGVEMVACVLSVSRGIVHPTANYETPDPQCDLDYVGDGAREVNVRIAMSNSFGFGGHNATLIVGAHAA